MHEWKPKQEKSTMYQARSFLFLCHEFSAKLSHNLIYHILASKSQQKCAELNFWTITSVYTNVKWPYTDLGFQGQKSNKYAPFAESLQQVSNYWKQ